MKTLSPDAVLIPHHGVSPISGIENIKSFWWPEDARPTMVTLFDSQIEEMFSSGDLGYIRGRFRLEFDYDGTHYSNQGNFLNVVQKHNGEWKLARLIWNDPVPEIQ